MPTARVSEELYRRYEVGTPSGFDRAQVTLSVRYEKGIDGAPKDYVLAYMWANLAAAQGTLWGEDAAKARDRIAELMTPEQIAEAQKLAREWRPKPER
jgi:uncharacterized protein